MAEKESEASDLKKELLQSLVERLRGRFFISFAISWLVLNYPIAMVILGDGDFDRKLAFLAKSNYFNESHTHWLPILAATSYTLFWKSISTTAETVAQFFHNLAARLKLFVEREDPVASGVSEGLIASRAEVVTPGKVENAGAMLEGNSPGFIR